MDNFALISSGSVVSAAIDLTKRDLRGFSVPVLDSTDIALKGSMDGSSASYGRIMDMRATVPSGDMRIATATGSRFVMLPDGFSAPPFLKIEAIMAVGSAQTDNRTFALLTRPRR